MNEHLAERIADTIIQVSQYGEIQTLTRQEILDSWVQIVDEYMGPHLVAAEEKVDELSKKLVLARAEAEGAMSMLMDVQQDCVRLKSELATARAEGIAEGRREMREEIKNMTNKERAEVLAAFPQPPPPRKKEVS